MTEKEIIEKFREVVELEFWQFKIPCSCPKGGIVDEDSNLVCPKCNGSEWVLPEELEELLTNILKELEPEEPKERKVLQEGSLSDMFKEIDK